ncbi:MAG: acetyltransferase [Bacteroidota bacterium]
MSTNKVAIVGYSGHAFVVCDTLISQSISIIGYFEEAEKTFNPFELAYLGSERSLENLNQLKDCEYFIGIGSNSIRKKITQQLEKKLQKAPTNAVHSSASISSKTNLGKGILFGNQVIVNACSEIGDGVICNTRATIEHDCKIGAFSHIAPGAILCGNVSIGEKSFIGAGSVVKQGVTIGKNVIVGAGTIVINDIADNQKVVGNPQRII